MLSTLEGGEGDTAVVKLAIYMYLVDLVLAQLILGSMHPLPGIYRLKFFSSIFLLFSALVHIKLPSM